MIDDLSGQRFGRLLVTGRAPNKGNGMKKRTAWFCRCDCGVTTASLASNLKRGLSKSCGCLRNDTKATLSHGMSGTLTYSSWTAMKTRCLYSAHDSFQKYSAFGICPQWIDSFETFFADMGERPGKKHSIERRDNAAGYSPENCYWATRTEQANNRKSSHYVEYAGERMTIAQWSRRTGTNQEMIRRRIKRGWSIQDALFEPHHVN